ncbi:MAG: ABC transporter permease [Bacteroidetes bacterium]|nr:MAG: ABC transporter permease [Bacteroidota bacterium]RLD73903.1 MAG: ABC transporter permease [Bacteroidota bacterium]RLD89435.1 MAG: ABC transporter permease [Bacteroidota bacterium]
MNLEYFIANKISSKASDVFSRPVIKISYVSIALGLALMIISVAIVIGFKSSISNKIIGFAAHMQIEGFSNNESIIEKPLQKDDEFLIQLRKRKDVRHMQFTALKAGVLKTEEQIQGVLLKGVDMNYDTTFLHGSLVDGHLPQISDEGITNEVIISSSLAKKMNLKTGDPVRVWFIGEDDKNARGRKFVISGVYNTSIEEFDNAYIIGDIRHVQKLNNWTENQVGKVELMVNDFRDVDQVARSIYKQIPYNLTVLTVKDRYPQIFNWLDLLDMNVIVILTLLILVAGITMISTLLIIIIERTNMVGVLKALGMRNKSVRKIFLYKASYIIIRGMLWGNVIGLLFYYVQEKFRLIKLNPENYYVNYVPVELNLNNIFLLNAGTFIICFLMLIIPSYYITRIQPLKALRFE